MGFGAIGGEGEDEEEKEEEEKEVLESKAPFPGFRLGCLPTKQLSATAITVYGYQPVLYFIVSSSSHIIRSSQLVVI